MTISKYNGMKIKRKSQNKAKPTRSKDNLDSMELMLLGRKLTHLRLVLHFGMISVFKVVGRLILLDFGVIGQSL